MAVATFDTLKFANTLKAAGIPEKQAEAEATVLAEALAVNLKDLVTKEDLALTKHDLERSLDLLRAELNVKFAEIDGKFKLLTWMIGALIPLVVAVLVRLFFLPIR